MLLRLLMRLRQGASHKAEETHTAHGDSNQHTQLTRVINTQSTLPSFLRCHSYEMLTHACANS